jgi:S1-C subfamily serine protease
MGHTRARISASLLVPGVFLLLTVPIVLANDQQYCSDRLYFQQRATEEKNWGLVERAAREYIGYCDWYGGQPGIVRALRALLLAHIAQEKFEDAVPIANRCTRLDPDDAICHALKADALLRTGQPRLAKESAQRAISIGAYDENSALGVRVAKNLLPQIEEAIVAHERSAKGQPESRPKIETARTPRFGTAWFTENGYAVTAYHVVQGAPQISLLGPQRSTFRASIVVADSRNDLAVLKVDTGSQRPRGLRIAQRPATLGGTAFTIGFPHPDVMGVQPKYTSGDISATTGAGDDPRFLQVSAPIQAGNSGGPLVGVNGEVIGVVVSKLSAARMLGATGDLTENVGYALKVGYLSPLIAELPSSGTRVSPLSGKSRDELISQVRDAVFLVVAE